ncbi:MAG: hypothetical protein ACK4RK_21090 [Gemmataceae bacterium]
MPLDIDKEMAALERMTAGQLAERFVELFGEPGRRRLVGARPALR